MLPVVIMKVSVRSATIKSKPNKKHNFEVRTITMGGHTIIVLKKNGNPILKCSPKEYNKFKQFIME